MSEIILKGAKRDPKGTSAKHLRKEGRVPGVFYAKDKEPVHFHVHSLDLRSVVYTAEAKVVDLQVDGDPARKCILKDVTFDPITDKILHIDLQGISAGQKMKVDLPLHFIGNSIGVREGGMLEHVMHKVHVLVDPTTMPEHIDIDISELGLNSAIHISDLNIPGVEFTDAPDSVIVTCALPKVSTETTEEAAAAAVETEEEEGESEE
jgi:large subunit ribosomal protein L25